jgi:hypothetical protein
VFGPGAGVDEEGGASEVLLAHRGSELGLNWPLSGPQQT